MNVKNRNKSLPEKTHVYDTSSGNQLNEQVPVLRPVMSPNSTYQWGDGSFDRWSVEYGGSLVTTKNPYIPLTFN